MWSSMAKLAAEKYEASNSFSAEFSDCTGVVGAVFGAVFGLHVFNIFEHKKALVSSSFECTAGRLSWIQSRVTNQSATMVEHEWMSTPCANDVTFSKVSFVELANL